MSDPSARSGRATSPLGRFVILVFAGVASWVAVSLAMGFANRPRVDIVDVRLHAPTNFSSKDRLWFSVPLFSDDSTQVSVTLRDSGGSTFSEDSAWFEVGGGWAEIDVRAPDTSEPVILAISIGRNQSSYRSASVRLLKRPEDGHLSLSGMPFDVFTAARADDAEGGPVEAGGFGGEGK